MPALHRRIAVAAAALAASCLAPAAWAEEPAGRSFVVVGEEGETLSITLDGSDLTIVTREGDASTVRVVDMEQMGLLVGDGLQEAFTALRDLQLDVHLGRDNRLDFSHGDRTFEVDVDAIMSGVHAALREGLDELETEDWTDVRERDRDVQELRAQLRELKDEVRRLQEELDSRGP